MITLIESKWLKILFSATYFAISVGTVIRFSGDLWSFTLFSISFFFFLYRRLMVRVSYFDLFLGLFFFLGFWAKANYHIYIDDFAMGDPVGSFKFNRDQFNRLMVVISLGILGFATARELSSLFQGKLAWNYSTNIKSKLESFESFYQNNRFHVLVLLIIACLSISILNLNFHIYQRGIASQAGSGVVRSIFAILLLFGFSACFCIFLKLDSKKGTLFFSTILLSLVEVFVSNVSLLSRGFILNSGSILLVAFHIQMTSVILSAKQIFFLAIAFLLLMTTSVKIVSLTREFHFHFKAPSQGAIQNVEAEEQRNFRAILLSLLIDRWVGLEGVMSAVGFEGNREEVFKEIYSESMSAGTSIYDKKIGKSIYRETATEDLQFVSLPGFIGWISILDNNCYIFLASLAAGLFCNLMESLIVSLLKNSFITALFGQVLAYRVSHFGYLPHQTYKLLVGIMIVVFGILLVQLLIGNIFYKQTSEGRENIA